MRQQDFDAAMELFPSRIASFDPDGITTGINQIQSNGALSKFVEAIKSSAPNSRTVIGQVWTISPMQQTILNDITKLTQLYNQTVGQLLPQAPVQQVIDAVTNFFNMLSHF